MKKQTVWKGLSLTLVFILMNSLMPELNLLGVLIDFVGLDIVILMIQAQVVMLFVVFLKDYIAPIIEIFFQRIERLDKFFLRSSIPQIIRCPALFAHAVPFLLLTMFYLL